MVCLDTPISRPTSSAFRPASTCFTAPIICASVCPLWLIRFSFLSSDYPTSLCADFGGKVISGQISVSGPVTPYATNFSYAPHGEPTNYTYGNGVYRQAAFNSRLQPV